MEQQNGILSIENSNHYGYVKQQNVAPSIDTSNHHGYVLNEPSHSDQILKGLNDFRKSGYLTDTVICVDGCEFPCHRAVLACSSPYFKAMFSSEMKETREGRITIDKISATVLEQLLEYAYTSTIVINSTNAQELLEFANLLQYKKIVEACSKYLQDQLHPCNCLGIQYLAEMHACQQLYSKAKMYAEANFGDVILNEDFLQLTLPQVMAYLSQDKLNVTKEETVFSGAMCWVDYKFQNRVAQIPMILECVRLQYMDAEFLNDRFRDPILNQLPACMTLLHKARKTQKKMVQDDKSIYHMPSQPREFTKTEVMVIVGGFDADHTWVQDVHCYNPTNRKWTMLAPFPADISGYKAVSLNNNIYVTGGKSTTGVTGAVFCYQSVCNQWKQVTGLDIARQFHGAASLGDSIYVVGGKDDNGCFISAVECYDPSIDKWKQMQPLPNAVGNPAVVSHNERLYVIGGYTCGQHTYKSMQCYDIQLHTWTIINMVILQTRHFPALVLNDNIYILSGPGRCGMQVYNPCTNTCVQTTAMCTQERHLFASAVIDCKMYVAGGMVNYKALRSMEVYDPDMNTWTSIGNMPKSLRPHGCCATIRKYLGPPYLN
ncbi:kelch-like protein 38 [Glandiceps talaboti]